MEHKGDGEDNCNWCTRNNLKRIGKGTGGLGNKRTSGDHPVYSTIKIVQNTEKSPGEIKRIAVNQTQVRNKQLKLM